MIRRDLVGVVASLQLAFAGGPALAQTAATTPRASQSSASREPAADIQDFVARVRAAVRDRDVAPFEKDLVDWDGARMRTRRLTLFQIRECFGRPVKSVSVEDLPKDAASEPLVSEGFRTNAPVTNLLRIEFDEPDHAPAETPACVFLLSKDKASSYKIALILPVAPHAP